MSQILLKLWLPEYFDVVLMCEPFRQNPRRSILERFHLFMNCCNMFFHVILDRKLNVLLNYGYQNSLMLCWCVRLLGKIQDVQFLSFFFNFALRNSKRRSKIECLRYCWKFGYQNSLMLSWWVKLLGKTRVQVLKIR